MNIKKAVILAAGLGNRLKLLTDEVPKVLTEINGIPILEQAVDILQKKGIEETVIVVGYLGDVVVDKIGSEYRGMKISYVWNRIYDETNSMYSAWLARGYLEQGAILIEGDTIFEENLIAAALATPAEQSCWVLDKFTEEFEGSMSIADGKGRIVELKIVRERLKEYRDNYYKSTGILKITREYGRAFSRWLDEHVKSGNVKIYYDLVIARHLHDLPMYVCNIAGSKWVEIDNIDDLKRAEDLFRPKRYAIVIIDGAADEPISELGNRTPLESADIPNIDYLAANGRTGLMRTMYPGLPVGSIVANLGILGYNPMRYYPNGRASFEALGQEIFLEDDHIAFRCNLISVEDGKIKDFTAKNISDEDARRIIQNLKLPDNNLKIYPGQSYRNLLIVKKVDFNTSEIINYEPHSNIGKPIKEILLEGTTPKSKRLVEKLNSVMIESIKQISKLNKKLKTDADMIFLWSPSSIPRLSSFHRKFGLDGAVVSGMDFMRGIATAARMARKKITGATGYSDTNLNEKIKDAQNYLRYNDLVYIHINAPDEESHNRNVKGKVAIMERIDREMVGPIKKFLDTNFPNNYRIAVLADHYTLLSDGTHSDKLVPYLIYGDDVALDNVKEFTEASVERESKSILKSYEFIDFLLSKK